ncbi:MAG TPA: dihydrolipoamide acetyltransferase family protein [Candidatus Hydrogenedens sp.]|nr:dihydrolipoamide acetyltransferase family protein [Candidatus Hydrogenedens sp.]HPP59561.1 dihydrolipoamide acetyltransferase family protein [Candidatus Hydrogenedens sp.]
MFEVKMPKLGQTVEEATIVQWLKKEGEPVKEGEPLFTVQTDKAEIEVESPTSGILLKILVEAGIEVPVLSVIALIGEENEAIPSEYMSGSPSVPTKEAIPSDEKSPQQKEEVPKESSTQKTDTIRTESYHSGKVIASPRAKKTASDANIPLELVTGSGVCGRIMSSDVQNALSNVPKATPVAKKLAEQEGIDLRTVSGTGPHGKITKEDIEKAKLIPKKEPSPVSSLPETLQRIPLTPMRKIIAERMSQSIHIAPHYYITVEIDMTNAKALRSQLPFKVSFNDIVLYAVVRTLREFPSVNVQWGGDCIIQMPDINLGVAVALPQGLIVPVIKKAQELSLEGLSKAAKELITKAQNNKLLPDDYTGNTFTVSNLGPYGVDHFTAIINQPDSAILAVGQIKERPTVVDGGIFIRPIMKVTMSCDHRVIDGALGGQFMGRFREILESADFM